MGKSLMKYREQVKGGRCKKVYREELNGERERKSKGEEGNRVHLKRKQ